MKRNEFKKILKPLIKECIKEVIFEEGVLSGIISEVIKGTNQNVIFETKQPKLQSKHTTPPKIKNKLNETKKKLLDAIGKGAYRDVNIFEGTKPIKEGDPHSPLANVDPGDQGVDISQIPGMQNWKTIAKGKG